MDVRAVYMNFHEFIPDSKEGLVSGPRSLFEDVVGDAISDPAWTSDDDGTE